MADPFHEGERLVQQRVGTTAMATRIGHSIHDQVPPAGVGFLAAQPFAIVASRDALGRVWASVVAARPGFLQSDDGRTIAIAATPAAGDPLAENVAVGAPLGMLVIDPATRRRLRINGEVTGHDPLRLAVREAFGNCPKYIHQRTLALEGGARARPMQRAAVLSPAQQRRVASADTFFVASQHAGAGLDASHRGGAAGFVEVVDAQHLAWPDYQGNMMFQTLGNLSVDPRAGLLFVDFATGDVLQLTGRATIDFSDERARRYAGAERVIDFAIDEVRDTAAQVALRAVRPSPAR